MAARLGLGNRESLGVSSLCANTILFYESSTMRVKDVGLLGHFSLLGFWAHSLFSLQFGVFGHFGASCMETDITE